MFEFTNKTDISFYPHSRHYAVNSTGNKLTTQAVKLGDLARLTHATWRVRGAIVFNAAATCELDVKVLVNGVERAAYSYTVSGAQVQPFDEPVNLSNVNGDDQISLQWEVMTADAAANTGAIQGSLEVSHPIVLGLASR